MARLQKRAQRATHEKFKPGVDPNSPMVQRGCAGKQHSFISRKRALAMAAAINKRHGFQLYVYRCSYCRGRFHLTSTNERDKRPVVTPIPGVHNGRQGRLWIPETLDDFVVESFVDQVFALVGLSTVEFSPEPRNLD